jgi:hypothetical protein
MIILYLFCDICRYPRLTFINRSKNRKEEKMILGITITIGLLIIMAKIMDEERGI